MWAVLKCSITGMWHHVSAKRLMRYVHEAGFRLIRGNCQVDTLDRMTALVERIGGRWLRYRDLVA